MRRRWSCQIIGIRSVPSMREIRGLAKGLRTAVNQVVSGLTLQMKNKHTRGLQKSQKEPVIHASTSPSLSSPSRFFETSR